MIELHGVTKRYPDGTVAVDSFSAQLPARTTTVLLGSSGSGKTTILRMINRMVEPTEGKITIDGIDISKRDKVALRRSIGYVMQNAGLLPHRKVIDNIATVPMLNGESRRNAQVRARQLMELVGLDETLANRYPAQLSGGQQQRVGVARGLAADPNILLMDEPFGAVDPLVRRELQEELLRLQTSLTKTIVFVTHDVDEALRLGDQIILLREGGVVAQRGPGAELLANPADDFVATFMGVAAGERTLRADGPVLRDAHGRAVGLLG